MDKVRFLLLTPRRCEFSTVEVTTTGSCGQATQELEFPPCTVGIAPHQVSHTRRDFTIQELLMTPTHQSVTMKLNSTKPATLHLQIYNIHGQLLTHDQIQTIGGLEMVDIDVSTYPAGVYLLQLGNRQGVESKRFIVAAQ